MSDFKTDVDIINRGLQRCGATRIVTRTEDTKNASETNFVYDKVREAELRRNFWVFAIRKCVLRPVDDNTRFLTYPAWASGTTYNVNDVVSYNGEVWYSTVASNLANTPSLQSAQWVLYFGSQVAQLHDATLTYFAGEVVYIASTAYLSLQNSNSDVPPTAKWRTLTGGTLTALNFIYPIGTGPATQSATRNVYILPHGYLRTAPQDPKAGSTSYLGAPSGLRYEDWEYENDAIISRDSLPIILRFVANVSDVNLMDPLFCEGLACRVAIEVCEPLTQSAEKLQSIGAAYKLFMSEARAVNGIEEGPTEPPEDDLIACRV